MITEDTAPTPPPGWEDVEFNAAGWGVGWVWSGWAPDRELNPQYAHLPDLPHAAVFYTHPRPDGTGTCAGSATVDGPAAAKVFPGQARWELVSEEPLHLEPSLLCRACGHHGFFRGGRWVPA